MFEQSLKESIQAIFDVKKVTYDLPSNAKEQEAIFIEITKSTHGFHNDRAICKVEGNGLMFANAEKLPFGFFAKKIEKADAALKKPFYFFDLESNSQSYQNIVQRGFSFVYFFDSQYDPKLGSITSVEFETTEE